MAIGESNIIGAYEAKTHFSELLERVAQGEELTITKHGASVAKLVPINKQKSTPAQRRAAIEAMREAAKHNFLNGLSIREMIAEGRR